MSQTQTTVRRPTPLDPYPEPREQEAEGDEKRYPPSLGTDAIAVLEGRTFAFSDASGDIPAGSVGGLLHDDTRFLSRWELTFDGQPLSLLRSEGVDYYSAAFFLANPDLRDLRANSIAVRRYRFVGNGMLEQIGAYNATPEPVRFELRLAAGADFADLFEVKSEVRDRSASISRTRGDEPPSLTFGYAADPFRAETIVEVVRSRVFDSASRELVDEPQPTWEDDDVVWRVELAPRQILLALVRVRLRLNGEELEPMHADFGEQQEHSEGALTRWLASVPRFECDSALLKSVVDQSVLDLAALRVAESFGGESYVLPAAGLPWFMTLFGRDTLITSLQTLWVGPELTRGALHVLGALQGKEVNEFRDEEPGKILHEIRAGELTVVGEKPHSPYYGTADATPLWLILMSEYWRHTGDDEFVRARRDQLLAALAWIDDHGDRDGDGYVEYQTRSSQGLGNQCWKDSWDGIQFSDGRLPYLPIATAEIQGYVYDAKHRVAELAERVLGDGELAARLRREADELFERFNRDFWSDERGGYYVVGLDGDKRQIDSMTSNMGHLLWSSIVPQERVAAIAEHLLSDVLFAGWGVRTMSREDAGYNPIGYHTGTIWPHDNSIVALGLAQHGYRDEANRIVLGQLEAASHSRFRLPEAFAGFEKFISPFPVPYPTACSPQAWATGAPFVFVKTMLGLDVREGDVRLDPRVPDDIGRIFVGGMPACGSYWDVEAIGSRGHVRLAR